jgi:hypothetical protein
LLILKQAKEKNSMGKSYEVFGIIHTIDETKSYGTSNFEKREFVIKVTGPEEKEQYPNYVALELIKDKCTILDAYEVGQEIKVQFNLGGRLWAGNGNGEKCFVSLTAWKIEKIHEAPAQQQAPASDFDESRYMPDVEDNGDIPF